VLFSGSISKVLFRFAFFLLLEAMLHFWFSLVSASLPLCFYMEKYESIKILGEGSFGKVYQMRHKIERKLVCIKCIKIKNIKKKEREACRLEVDLLRKLNHPNIVGYEESFLTKKKDTLCIVMTYCDGGDLAGIIKGAKKQRFSENKVLEWFVQIALGLHYMHENRVLHRDLKTQNIFMLGNGEPNHA
jgi:NIMA (never in mitosis gene a)-related kinase